MRTRRMAAATTLDPSLGLECPRKNLDHIQHGAVVEEIQGLIRVYRDGHVERLPVVPCVPSTASAPDRGVTSSDIVIDKLTNVWARVYIPTRQVIATTTNSKHKQQQKLPVLVYFHGGGFCLGSAAWSCYHEFLERLANKAGCVIMSVNYRLAPENPLPAAYEDGFQSLTWLQQQATMMMSSRVGGGADRHGSAESWFARQCDFSRVFLAGDSAGANIAHTVASRLHNTTLNPLTFKGTVLVQPFFGGEARTYSEKHAPAAPSSALSLAASDTYWRLALPRGSDRDHPWSNPAAGSRYGAVRLPMLVCISETDILRDRNLEFCCGLAVDVEQVTYEGVGHAFQILGKSQVSVSRTRQMMDRIKAFIITRS